MECGKWIDENNSSDEFEDFKLNPNQKNVKWKEIQKRYTFIAPISKSAVFPDSEIIERKDSLFMSSQRDNGKGKRKFPSDFLEFPLKRIQKDHQKQSLGTNSCSRQKCLHTTPCTVTIPRSEDPSNPCFRLPPHIFLSSFSKQILTRPLCINPNGFNNIKRQDSITVKTCHSAKIIVSDDETSTSDFEILLPRKISSNQSKIEALDDCLKPSETFESDNSSSRSSSPSLFSQLSQIKTSVKESSSSNCSSRSPSPSLLSQQSSPLVKCKSSSQKTENVTSSSNFIKNATISTEMNFESSSGSSSPSLFSQQSNSVFIYNSSQTNKTETSIMKSRTNSVEEKHIRSISEPPSTCLFSQQPIDLLNCKNLSQIKNKIAIMVTNDRTNSAVEKNAMSPSRSLSPSFLSRQSKDEMNCKNLSQIKKETSVVTENITNLTIGKKVGTPSRSPSPSLFSQQSSDITNCKNMSQIKKETSIVTENVTNLAENKKVRSVSRSLSPNLFSQQENPLVNCNSLNQIDEKETAIKNKTNSAEKNVTSTSQLSPPNLFSQLSNHLLNLKNISQSTNKKIPSTNVLKNITESLVDGKNFISDSRSPSPNLVSQCFKHIDSSQSSELHTLKPSKVKEELDENSNKCKAKSLSNNSSNSCNDASSNFVRKFIFIEPLINHKSQKAASSKRAYRSPSPDFNYSQEDEVVYVKSDDENEVEHQDGALNDLFYISSDEEMEGSWENTHINYDLKEIEHKSNSIDNMPQTLPFTLKSSDDEDEEEVDDRSFCYGSQPFTFDDEMNDASSFDVDDVPTESKETEPFLTVSSEAKSNLNNLEESLLENISSSLDSEDELTKYFKEDSFVTTSSLAKNKTSHQKSALDNSSESGHQPDGNNTDINCSSKLKGAKPRSTIMLSQLPEAPKKKKSCNKKISLPSSSLIETSVENGWLNKKTPKKNEKEMLRKKKKEKDKKERRKKQGKFIDIRKKCREGYLNQSCYATINAVTTSKSHLGIVSKSKLTKDVTTSSTHTHVPSVHPDSRPSSKKDTSPLSVAKLLENHAKIKVPEARFRSRQFSLTEAMLTAKQREQFNKTKPTMRPREQLNETILTVIQREKLNNFNNKDESKKIISPRLSSDYSKSVIYAKPRKEEIPTSFRSKEAQPIYNIKEALDMPSTIVAKRPETNSILAKTIVPSNVPAAKSSSLTSVLKGYSKQLSTTRKKVSFSDIVDSHIIPDRENYPALHSPPVPMSCLMNIRKTSVFGNIQVPILQGDVVGNILQDSNILNSESNNLVKSVSLPCEIKDFVHHLLIFNPPWLIEQSKFRQQKLDSVPPFLAMHYKYPSALCYDSYMDYFRIYQSLLILETWEKIFRDYPHYQTKSIEATAVGKDVDVKSTIIDKKERLFRTLTFQGTTSKTDSWPAEKDFILLEQLNKNMKWRCFGYIKKTEKNYAGTQCHVTIVVTFKLNQSHPVEINTKLAIKKVSNLTPSLRQFKALVCIPRSNLIKDILEPGPDHFQPNLLNIIGKSLHMPEPNRFNHSQRNTILRAAEMALLPYSIPKILLIQGPPGTGKSHTIIGIIQQIFAEASLGNISDQSIANPKILLCAPSNDAIDHVVNQVIKYFDKHDSHMLLRLKSTSSNNYTSKFTLDYYMEKYLKKRQKSEELLSYNQSIRHHEKQMKVFEKRRLVAEAVKDGHELENIDTKLRQLWTKVANIKKQTVKVKASNSTFTWEQKIQMQSDIFNDADIVACTLNSSGSYNLEQHWKNGKNINMRKFTCVIIDEAANCTELDTLIPLQYFSTKLILVGDPKQLPPTILSEKAANLFFGISMMERFCQYFDEAPQNILLLDSQYRMHPEICSFPSKHFYEGRLKCDHSLENRYNSFPFQPYLVFDLLESQESVKNNGSVVNEFEAQFTVDLCNHLVEYIESYQIGIITPYKEQKENLRQRLADKNGLDVNTVDGFQGQEKDLIILSCVRAKNASRNIGFVNNAKRMNVALTRAKCSLFIVGHLKSLEVNSDWKALIQDARQRNVVVTIKSYQDLHYLDRTLLKQRSSLK